MVRALVIVESPAKAKTINKYLGKDFVVKSSYGHVRDLPTSGDGGAGEAEESPEDKAAKKKAAAAEKKAAGKKGVKADPLKAKAATASARIVRAKSNLIRRMGVDPDHGWAADYRVLPNKTKVLAELRAAAEKADEIYLASDLDREGEAIAWHLKEAIGGDEKRYKRVIFSEITKPAIQAAFAHPGTINMDRVHAQQARRFLDRVVGFMVSPLLWAKIARGLSAGRVQSVATRLIVERERAIRAFIPVEYWDLHADLSRSAKSTTTDLRAEVVRAGGEPFKPITAAQTQIAVDALKNATFTVAAIDERPHKSKAPTPFITSTLQQEASNRLGFSVKKTMTLAQHLYEAGHITYMRTDALNLSPDAVAACRALINARFGAKYLPPAPMVYPSKAGAQEAHEAIRPTDVTVDSASLTADSDEIRLYDLIWKRFVACQMPPAESDTTAVIITAAGYDLRATGRVLRFDGWQKVLPPARSDDQSLPALTVGQVMGLVKLDPQQHFTKPPPRYGEAGLVGELEKQGIGRPSTYASIISTIQERGYVKLANRRFYAEKLGDIVTGRLVDAFPDLMSYSFTAGMEQNLDKVASAEAPWQGVLDDFYHDFTGKLETASNAMRPNTPVPTAIACPTCGRPMAVRTGRTGVFLGCTGYDLPPKERCTKTINLVPGDEAETVVGPDDEAAEGDADALRAKKRCPICSTAMDAYLVDETRKLHICGNNPDCTGTAVEIGTYKLRGYEGPTFACDKCGKPMQLKSGRFGKYFGCTGWPECANTRKLMRSGEPAPPKIAPVHMSELLCSDGKSHFVLRDGLLGLFLAASSYPKLRETKPPQVADLVRHKADLDPKYHWLADAPAKDGEGRPTIIRFSRKTKEHYLASEGADGKPSGWTMWLVDGRWTQKKAEVEEDAPRRGKRPAAASKN